jgi:hypothetical protein
MAGPAKPAKEIADLAEEDYRQLCSWFLERDWERWDKGILADSSAGRLDFLVKEALDAKKEDELRKVRIGEFLEMKP